MMFRTDTASPALLAVLTFSLVACERDAPVYDSPIETEPVPEQTTPEPQPPGLEADAAGEAVITAELEPAVGSDAGRRTSGQVRVLRGAETGGDYQVAVAIEGLSSGEHAWHIHSGRCGTDGPVVVAFTNTREMSGIADALRAGDDGKAERTVSVPAGALSLEQLQSGDYSLHVHERGGVDHGRSVACANL